jgi:hypothetical protein
VFRKAASRDAAALLSVIMCGPGCGSVAAGNVFERKSHVLLTAESKTISRAPDARFPFSNSTDEMKTPEWDETMTQGPVVITSISPSRHLLLLRRCALAELDLVGQEHASHGDALARRHHLRPDHRRDLRLAVAALTEEFGLRRLTPQLKFGPR